MRHTHHTFTLLLSLALSAAAWDLGHDFASPGYSSGGAEYLKTPVQARSAALGGAVTAWSSGLAGLQFNPAILDAIEPEQVTARGSYAIMSLGRQMYGVDVASGIGDLVALSVSLTHRGDEGIERRDEFGFIDQADPEFGYVTNEIDAVAAGRLKWNISVGGRARYLFERLDTDQAHGVGMDLGATWHPLPQLCIGVSGMNILSNLWWSTGHRDPVQTTARLGINGSFLDKSLTVEADFVKPINQPIEGGLGVEYTVLKMVSIRGGASSAVDMVDKQLQWPDFGVGIGVDLSYVGFDYGLTIPASGLGLLNRISVVARIPSN